MNRRLWPALLLMVGRMAATFVESPAPQSCHDVQQGHQLQPNSARVGHRQLAGMQALAMAACIPRHKPKIVVVVVVQTSAASCRMEKNCGAAMVRAHQPASSLAGKLRYRCGASAQCSLLTLLALPTTTQHKTSHHPPNTVRGCLCAHKRCASTPNQCRQRKRCMTFSADDASNQEHALFLSRLSRSKCDPHAPVSYCLSVLHRGHISQGFAQFEPRQKHCRARLLQRSHQSLRSCSSRTFSLLPLSPS
jgi:hypothetical protein